MTTNVKHGCYEDLDDGYGENDISDLLAEGLVDLDNLPINKVAEAIMARKLRERESSFPVYTPPDSPVLSSEELDWCCIPFD